MSEKKARKKATYGARHGHLYVPETNRGDALQDHFSHQEGNAPLRKRQSKQRHSTLPA